MVDTTDNPIRERTGKISDRAYAYDQQDIIEALDSSPDGLSQNDVVTRISKFGSNSLPEEKSKNLFIIFIQQFVSPLIYVLLAATVLSLAIKEWLDATFIFAVLIINAIIVIVPTT